ncbi:type IV pilus secretin PilQ [Usitatibacter palustris]|uniref:Type IV pilus biogenesis and competence protein PilQ n=1 Tax=Usitatibacter palustris TaxID=2732487 RepID=A0A6M4H197_9PROT|nr:type IV pilus secretin PilQ [Usitatibacter palustris]QJR13240.1 Type 3 secretion system secretin [Usitatibacter palustris]
MIATLRNKTRTFTTALAAVALVLAAPLAWAQAAAAKNAVESINFSSIQGGKIVVKVGFKDALKAVPQGFAVTNPPRIAIDLPDTVNGLGKNQVEAGEGDLKNVSVVQTATRTRLVMNLTRNLTYTQVLDGKLLVVTIDGSQAQTSGGAQATAPSAGTTVFAEPAPGAQVRYNLRDVDFRRGNTGEGRVIVDLSSANVGIDIRQQGRQVLVDFLSTNVPRNLVRRLDVGDFGTPVRFVDTFEQGGNARMVIEPRGIWEYSAYQTDTQFILEVKPVKEDPNKLVQSSTPGYAGEKLSLNFQNVEVRAVLQVIADFTGLNIITSDTVGGNLTLRLKDVPWDQALDIILQSKGLSKRKNGNVVLIAPTDELAAKEKLALEANAAISDLEPVRTESFALSYAKAEDLKKLLSDKDQKILSKRGSATIDERTNTLFVQDTGGRLEEARRLILQLDVPVRQVLIEARIVIADDKWGRQLGARFGTQSAFNRNNYNFGVSGSGVDTVNALQNNPVSRGSASLVYPGGDPQGAFGTTGNIGTIPIGAQPEQLNVNLPVAGAAGQIALSILNLGSGNLVNVELSALEADNRGKVVSSPRVITADKKKAVISQGTEIGYFTAAASGATTITFKPAVLELAVTPRITPDDRIIMDLEVKKDAVGVVFSGIPSIDTKRVSTQVLVDNGDTIVLGGIFEQTTRTTVDKVPFFGDIPFVGYLFKRTNKQDDKTELLIFVTPKIVKDVLTVR